MFKQIYDVRVYSIHMEACTNVLSSTLHVLSLCKLRVRFVRWYVNVLWLGDITEDYVVCAAILVFFLYTNQLLVWYISPFHQLFVRLYW